MDPQRHDPPSHPHATDKSLERWESLWEKPCIWTGTDYPSDPSILADLADEDGPLRRPVPYSISFQTAIQHLRSLHIPNRALSPSQEAAAARLRTLHELDFSDKWLGDIAMKMFSDFDILLFESSLGGNVYLDYTTVQITPQFKYETAGTVLPGDYTTRSKRKSRRFMILLNADKLLLDGRRRLRDLIAMLVHEMTHAYTMLWVGSEDGQLDPSGEHSMGFCQCIDAVNLTLRAYTGFEAVYERPDSWRIYV